MTPCRHLDAAYKGTDRASYRLARSSWRGASDLSVLAVQTMPASVVGAVLLMTLACSMYLIALALVRVDGAPG